MIDDQLVNKEIYLKYIAERPRVEKINAHGLFNSSGEAGLKKEIEDIKNHKGVVWTHIISLKREDAERLGYDNLKQWQLLLKTKMPQIAESMNIELKNLVWNAAFHNEGYHPHVHLVMYSKNTKEVKQQIDKIVENITKNKNIKLLYEKYQEYKKDMTVYYSSKEYETKDITKDKEFRKLQNMISKTADRFRKIDLGNNEEIIDIHEVASTDTIKERLKKLDEEKKEIETNYNTRQEKRNKEIALNASNREDVRKNNLKQEVEGVLKSRKKSVTAMEKRFLTVLDKYNSGNELFKAELEAVENGVHRENSLKQFDDLNFETQKHIMKALALIVSDPDIKSDYEKYKESCEEYNMLSCGNASDHSDLKDMANELISTVNYNIAMKGKEIERLSIVVEDDIKTIENKFLTVLNDCNENNTEFKNILTASKENHYMYDIKDEPKEVNRCVNKAIEIVLNDLAIKEEYETYKTDCAKYTKMTNESTDKVIDNGLLDMKNEVLNLLNCENNLSTGGKNELENKVVNGAKRIKKEYSLSPKIDVTYNDYSKQNQESLKYAVKGIIFDIVDSLYFSAGRRKAKE